MGAGSIIVARAAVPARAGRAGGAAAALAAGWRRLGAACDGARGRLFPLVPVALGGGIGLWFALPVAPAPGALGALAVLAAALAVVWRWRERAGGAAPLVAATLALVCAGVVLAGWRAERVAAPVLAHRYYGAIEGRVVAIDRSLSDRPRLTLDRVVLERMDPAATPARVRVSVHGAPPPGGLPVPGQVAILTGHLSPPEGPVEPGGFDFRRHAWFARLGAVGYTRTPVLLIDPGDRPGAALALDRLRLRLAGAIRARIPGEPGAFAAAVSTGDRSAVGRDTIDALRASNLAHLLAISGLHMGLVTGFVFAALRLGIAAVPPLALRLPGRKLAAVAALAVGAFYLALSGGSVSTQRAFVMVAVMLGAVLADRRAISLRSVALAAVLILLIRPEALIEAGFQMSFAATAALVVAFGALGAGGRLRRLPGVWRALVGVVLSSGVAGLATAPLAAAAFNRLSDYGLVANVVAVPVMGLAVMPAAVIAALLAPLGLAAPALWVMEAGTRWILAVAAEVSGWGGAVTGVPAPPWAVVPMLALGAAWAVVWPGRARWAGAVAMAAALALWAAAARPSLVISGDGAMVGLMTEAGRAYPRPGGAAFAMRAWLEDDGDLATPEEAAARAGFSGPRGARAFAFGPWQGLHLTGRDAGAALAGACRPGVLVITDALVPALSPALATPDPGRDALAAAAAGRGGVRLAGGPAAEGPAGGCVLIDARFLAVSGALAIEPAAGGGLHLRGVPPGKPWSPAARPR